MLAIAIFGGIFASIGIAVAHLLTKHAGDYYLILFPVFVLAIILGMGLSLGAKIGRCSRFNLFTFLLVTLFVLGSYLSVLFLNAYHDSFETPLTFVDEKIFLIHDTWNLAAELPFISDYVKPITIQELQSGFAGIPFVSDLMTPLEESPPAPESETSDSESETPTVPSTSRPHLASQLRTFFNQLPEQALSMEQPVLIGTIFNLAIFAPLEDRLVFSGITRWEENAQEDETQQEGTTQDAGNQRKRLVFDERAVQPWMQWSVELLLLWSIALLMTRGGAKKALRRLEKRQRRRDQPGLQVDKTGPKKTKKIATEADVDPEKKGAKKKKKVKVKKEKIKKEKSGGWFGRKKKNTEDEPPEAAFLPEEKASATETSAEQDELEFEIPGAEEEEGQLLALILHQYAPERQEDLVRLIQQIGQVSEARARRLLKIPSLIKRDITPHEANIAIEKFNQVQAQVKLITMEQLQQLQNKQTQSAQASTKKPASKSAPPSVSPGQAAPNARYALILRKFDPARRKEVLDLLSGLSGTPVAQLQQSLKTPALVLRDASKDEATMIVQQFNNIQAEVKMLTMPELQKLMAKK